VEIGIELLAAQMSETYTTLLTTLTGLRDEEFFWEPVPDCWTVFQNDRGDWTYQYEEPDPTPAPFTTIGWRLVHIALCKVIYHEWAFGPARLRFDTIENPSDVATSMTMLHEGQQLLGEDLAALTNHDLMRPVRTNWGERWPAWRIFWTMAQHDAHHGAEIGVLRDLYRARAGSGSGIAPR
jgi:hypothetical protein